MVDILSFSVSVYPMYLCICVSPKNLTRALSAYKRFCMCILKDSYKILGSA